MRTVYADVVIVVNFSIDFVILYLTAFIYKINVSKVRLVLSSLVGAFFSLVGAIFTIPYIVLFVLGVFVCFSMIVTAFGMRSKRMYLRFMLSVYILSFLLSSFAEVLYNIFKTYISINGGEGMWIVFTGAGILMICCMLFTRYFCKTVSNKKVNVWVQTEKTQREYTLLCDSGNYLCDPYCNLSVIVLKKQAEMELCEKDGTYDSYIQNHTRYIPVNTAFGNGVIKAIKPKGVMIKNDKNVYKNVDVIIAFSPNEENDFAGSDGIIAQSVVDTIN